MLRVQQAPPKDPSTLYCKSRHETCRAMDSWISNATSFLSGWWGKDKMSLGNLMAMLTENNIGFPVLWYPCGALETFSAPQDSAWDLHSSPSRLTEQPLWVHHVADLMDMRTKDVLRQGKKRGVPFLLSHFHTFTLSLHSVKGDDALSCTGQMLS